MKFGAHDVGKIVFAESDGEMAIYNIAPIVPGHVLILPKEPLESLNDLREEQLQSFFSFARKVTNFIVQEFKATDFDWTIQDGRAAGQTIPHLHLHVIPRVKGDFPNPGDWYPVFEKSLEENIDSDGRKRLSEEEMGEIVRYLRGRWVSGNETKSQQIQTMRR